MRTPDANSHPVEQLLNQLAQQIAQYLRTLQATEQTGGAGETNASPWLNAASAATYLDWPLQRIYKLTAQGAIPHYKQDGRLLFNRQELDQWLQQHRQPGDWINSDNRAICP